MLFYYVVQRKVFILKSSKHWDPIVFEITKVQLRIYVQIMDFCSIGKINCLKLR